MSLLVERFRCASGGGRGGMTGSSAFGNVRHSTWSSTYQDPSPAGPADERRGSSSRARVAVTTPRGEDRQLFTQVTYSPAIDGTDVDGLWSYASSNGWFSFRVSLEAVNF